MIKIYKKAKSIWHRFETSVQKLELIHAQIDTLLNNKKNLTNKVLSVLKYLRPYETESLDKIRIGRNLDGGYVFLNDFKNIDTVFSFGISNEDSADIDCANKGLKVLQFDHTVDNAPTYHKNCTFFKKKIVPNWSNEGVSISELIKENKKDYPSIILKCDIEDSEWKVFDSTSLDELSCFSQICIEYHNLDKLYDDSRFEIVSRVFKKIDEIFYVSHIHANNYGIMTKLEDFSYPAILEVTYANRKLYKPLDSKPIFPIDNIDFPNNPAKPDYQLGCFWFNYYDIKK